MPGSTTDDDRPLDDRPLEVPSAAPDASDVGPPGAPHPRIRRWIAVAIIVLVVAGVSAVLLARHGTKGSTSGTPGGSSGPRASYVLPLVGLNQYRMRSGGSASTGTLVAAQIRDALSVFYDRAFLEPQTWSDGVPAQAWSVFAPDLASRAKADADSLSLGSSATRIGDLSVSSASLRVSVLFDPSGHATTATAVVELHASGTLKGGGAVQVAVNASYLLKPLSGRWVVVGYPVAKTTVDALPGPPATPSAAGGP
jgi:hypothetical protein